MRGPRDGRVDEAAPSEARLRAAKGLLAAILISAPLALGALPVAVVAAVGVAAAIAACVAWWGAEEARPRAAASALVATAIGLTAWTALQAIPIRVGVLARLAPANADVWARALAPLHEAGPAWAPLTLDPPATHAEVLRGATYLLVLLATLRVGARRRGADFLGGALIASSLVLAMAATLHPAFGAERVFGLYRPVNPIAPRHIAPILNPNALGGYLDVGFAVAVAWSIAPRPPLPRAFPIAAVVVLAVVELWVASRGGVAAMVIAAVAVLVVASLARRERVGVGRSVAGAAALLAAGVAMCVVAGSDEAWRELAATNVSKLELNVVVFKMVRAFPVFGVGRGAFESAFPAFRGGAGHVVFTHPENVVSQWASEWGAPAALLAFAAIAWALRPTVAHARGHSALGAWAALVAVGLQNLADFGTEVPALAIALVVCAGLVVGGTSGDAQQRSAWSAWARAPRAASLVGAGVLLASIAWVSRDHGDDLDADRVALHDLALAPDVSLASFHDAARAAMLRHPAEPYLAFAGELRAARARDESVVPWAEKVLERAPVYGPAHLLLARALFRSGPAQARLEYRIAAEQAPELSSWAMTEAAPLVGSADDAMELVPGGAVGVAVLEALATAVGARLPATQVRLDEEIASRDPASPAPRVRAAARAIADLADGEGAPWCERDRARCVAIAIDRGRDVVAALPRSCEGYVLSARARAAAGDARRGAEELASAADHVDDRVGCLSALIGITEAAHLDDLETIAIDALARAACASDEECAANLMFAAAADERRGNPRRALVLLRAAYARAPRHEEALVAALGLARGLSLHGESIEILQALARAHPDDARWSADLAREREELTRARPRE